MDQSKRIHEFLCAYDQFARFLIEWCEPAVAIVVLASLERRTRKLRREHKRAWDEIAALNAEAQTLQAIQQAKDQQ